MREENTREQRLAEGYVRLVQQAAGEGCCPAGRPDPFLLRLAGYGEEGTASLPGRASALFLGCGRPLSHDPVAAGGTLLDLGAGAGLDLLLASPVVGERGRVIGLEMTAPMVSAAEKSIRESGFGNVDIIRGRMEEIPLAASSVDGIMSNCAVNLSSDRGLVFAESARVLRPGGRVVIADMFADELPGWVRQNATLYSACVAGAAGEEEYVEALLSAGFADVEAKPLLVHDGDQLKAFIQCELTGAPAGNPCSCSDFLTESLLGRAAELVAGRVRSMTVTARRAG